MNTKQRANLLTRITKMLEQLDEHQEELKINDCEWLDLIQRKATRISRKWEDNRLQQADRRQEA